ncbi:hypothetical protein LTR10_022443 [Elasticomyces elasticus]|uniref:Cupin type-2 domain-containing protein n=1 Tax=Exophiala sideris TaxID=1016849 RepID=A0ABR0J2H7_9EURO|nr:hypothetical protein LTR10_022443 [Elasticomyces elasticus]KAK5024879.1 hypothetical protein LTS07_008257 [Exophiala sideris]KAK5031531.1 hypothetical protein LTR13_007859 [Exophiala sideris]KAK5054918.1 hypothetical protein LTR69_008486 [Exophiala sideris]KAK5179797.1 hypothetical protein LTR44_007613 [Eurotiomycetes sp. CCFEE 6388]
MGINTGTPVRRVVTGHNDLKSVVQIDDQLNLIPGFASEAVTVWQHEKYPAELSNEDAAKGKTQIYSSGSLIRVVDFPPKAQGHNHRTLSLDYGIILDGELELVLEEGRTTIVRAGDIVVQQATIHQWNNNTDKPTRVVFVLLPSVAPEQNGKSLDDVGYPPEFKPTWRKDL